MSLDLDLLLTNADDHRPALAESLPVASTAGMDPPDPLSKPAGLRHDGADPSSLPLQRWGVVAPEGPAGDRLIALIDPLIRARREGQGGAPVIVLRSPPGLTAAEARAWKKSAYDSVAPADQPRYLAFLGDFDVLSVELQQVLGADTFAGRIAFREERDYEAYAAKILRFERSPPAAPRARALFHSVQDGTRATAMGHSALMKPSRKQCLDQRALGNFAAGEIVEIEADLPDDMLAEAARPAPSVLFTMSHGLGAPRRGWRSAEEQRDLQGSMCFGPREQITAADVASRSFLPGGVWFYFACFGAGTPGRSAFYPWLKRLHDLGEHAERLDPVIASLPKDGGRPFVAALPQAALANPEGPLAVIGHVDLAWTYSYEDPWKGGMTYPSRFFSILRALSDGIRAGVAHAELARFGADTGLELLELYNEDAAAEAWAQAGPASAGREARRAHLWMRAQDLASYLLLGDPAARLPIEQGASIANGAGGARGMDTRGGEQADVEAMEVAVISLLGGGGAPEAIAARAGVREEEIRRWADTYREAGRAALARLKRGPA